MEDRRSEARLAGVELGGTNAIVVLGRGTEIVERKRFTVGAPHATLAAIEEQLRHWTEVEPIAALGIASFGPIELDPANPSYGQILLTPKPGWAGAGVLAQLQEAIDCPALVHTDVTAAALAEGRFGAARGCSDFIYMTIGTGIGVGIITGGRPVIGRLHPEAGHMRVRRVDRDSFAGSCPIHMDCLEGLAAGPALAARAGKAGEWLTNDDSVWASVVDALAEGCANLFLTLASERIVLGGGVANGRAWLADAVGRSTAAKLGGYLPFVVDQAPVVMAALGADAGPRGALLLAEQALAGEAVAKGV
ncbi:MAG TPA: ROK family protein [Sphingomicrobium sp.]|nr:ROK family protein [Sphingomicrobium sp.]